MSFFKQIRSMVSAKVMVVTLITLILAFGFSTFLQVRLLKATIIEQKVLRASTLVRSVQKHLSEEESVDNVVLQRIIDDFSLESDVDRLFIVDKKYQVIAHNKGAIIKSYYKNEDMRIAISQKRTKWGVEDHKEKGRVIRRIDVATPIFFKGEHIGGLEAELTVDDVAQATDSALSRTIALGLVALLMLFALLTRLLSYLILRPLEMISRGAREVTSGNLDYRISLKSSDELGQVANAFDEMVGSLKRKQNVLKKLACTDSLTGLLNHRFFYEHLDDEMERAKRYKHHLSICMVDIDFFKDFNDANGHLEGDRALLKIARILQSTVRSSDLVGRLGGEEFGILLREQGPEQALEVAERLRHRVDNHQFVTDKHGYSHLTISIGIAAYPEDSEKASELANLADKGLYQAKAMGRNLVCHAKIKVAVKKVRGA